MCTSRSPKALPISGWPRGAKFDLSTHAAVYVGFIAVAVDVVTASARAGDVFSYWSLLCWPIHGSETTCRNGGWQRRLPERSDCVASNKHHNRNRNRRNPEKTIIRAWLRQRDSFNGRAAAKSAHASIVRIPSLASSANSKVQHRMACSGAQG